MNRVNNTDGSAASLARPTNKFVNNEGKLLLSGGRGVQRTISRRLKPLAGWVAACVLFFSTCISVHAGLLKADVDFSNYDTPLFQQIVNRIKDKVAARLGTSESPIVGLSPLAYVNFRFLSCSRKDPLS